MFYHPETQTTYVSVEAFRLANPNTSYGDMVTEEQRNAFGLYSVLMDAPQYDGELQYVTQTGVVEQGGKYVMGYAIHERDLTPEQRAEILVRRYTDALTGHLDAVAQARRYDNRITCSLRAGYPGPFQAEGAAFAAWMDTCNALGYQILAEVQAGARPLPTVDEFIALLPEMVWPDAS